MHLWNGENYQRRVGLQTAERPSRRCAFEHMEPRVMLAADLALSGQMPPISTPGGATGSIAGSVFAAPATEACAAHDHATGLHEVQVQLLDQTGTVIAEATTDEQGAYHFEDLMPGEYSLRTVAIAGEAIATPQQVDQIAVQGGVAMTDYDFCHAQDAPVSNEALTDPASSLASVLAFVYADQPQQVTPVRNETFVATNSSGDTFAQSALQSSESAELYGGSSRELKRPDSIKAWDEYRWDGGSASGLFSTMHFLDITGNESVGLATLDSIYGEAEQAGNEFADRYTSESLDWCDCDEEVEVQDVLGLDEGRPAAGDWFAEQAVEVPQVAAHSVPARRQ